MILRIAAACAFAALLAFVFVARASTRMPDFEVYWHAAARASAAEPLYREDDGHYQLKYLPGFAVLALPLGWLPLGAAKAAWFAGSALLLVAVLAMSLALLPDRRKPAWLLVTLTLIVMAKFYGHELVLGQVNLLLAALALAAVHLLIRHHGAAAGALIAIAVVVKPYAVILVPWLIARRARAAVIASTVGIAAAIALPAVIYGAAATVALHLDWWHTVTASTGPNLLNADNVSLAAMFAKWLGPGDPAAALAFASSLLLVAAAAFVVLRGRHVGQPHGLEAALLLMIMPLLSPQGWDYVLLVSTPAVMYLLNEERSLPAALRAATLGALAIIAFSLYDVLGRDAYARFMEWSIISVCYLIVVAALVVLRARRIA